MTVIPFDEIPHELKPYFDCTYINCFAICDFCGTENEFFSNSKTYSDQWYLDMAISIKNAGWIIPKPLVAVCTSCASLHSGLKHNPDAF